MGKRGPKAEPFQLKPAELAVVETELGKRKVEKSVADRCRIALLSHQGFGPTEIAVRVGLHVSSVDRLLKRFRMERLAVLHDKPRSGRPRSISPLQRAAIVALACSPPADSGRPIARWTHNELAAQAESDSIIESIHPATIGRILDAAECRPHRVRYWLRSRDPDFLAKATRALWYYERAESLLERGIVVICLDEKPNMQALTPRLPDIAPAPGHDRRREFDYKRHGTVNLLLALTVATGKVWGEVLEKNDSANFIPALRRLVSGFPDARRIEVILDNGSSHVSAATREAVRELGGRVRLHFTPAHASWLNQAEIGLGAIHRRYIRGVPFDSREALIERTRIAIEDYNEHYATPINWSYSVNAMKDWYDRPKLQPYLRS